MKLYNTPRADLIILNQVKNVTYSFWATPWEAIIRYSTWAILQSKGMKLNSQT